MFYKMEWEGHDEKLVIDTELEGSAVLEAIKDAMSEFTLTREGIRDYFRERILFPKKKESYTLADFAFYVPNKICRRHGIEKVATGETCNSIGGAIPLDLDWTENLVPRLEFQVTIIAGAKGGRPEKLRVPLSKLLEKGEDAGNMIMYHREVLLARCADYVADIHKGDLILETC